MKLVRVKSYITQLTCIQVTTVYAPTTQKHEIENVLEAIAAIGILQACSFEQMSFPVYYPILKYMFHHSLEM